MDYRHYQVLRGPTRTLGMMQAHEFSKRFWAGTGHRKEGICACGKHKGLTLLSNGKVHEFPREIKGVRPGNKAEGLCPVSFWLARAQIIMIEQGGKEAIEWMKEHTLEEFLKGYSLEST